MQSFLDGAFSFSAQYDIIDLIILMNVFTSSKHVEKWALDFKHTQTRPMTFS